MALFDCTVNATSGNARALTYETTHGPFQTPMFMPVGTSATVKGITVRQLEELGAQVVLANTYHLSQRPGPEIVAEAGGVHGFSGYQGPMLTDSGRVPDLLAGRHPQAGRRRRNLPLGVRRHLRALDPRGEHAHPTASGG